jgi:uncharacterized membrane protein
VSNASWQVFALGSAFFAPSTATFGKVGVSKLMSIKSLWIDFIFPESGI